MKYYNGVQVLGASALWYAMVGEEKAATQCALLAVHCQKAAEDVDAGRRESSPAADIANFPTPFLAATNEVLQ